MPTNFYKVNGSYYTADTNQKIANLTELQNFSKAGGKEISAPTPKAGSVAIPAPEAIKDYNVTNRIGGTLYGTPKISNTINTTDLAAGASNAGLTPPPTIAGLIHDTFAKNAQSFTQAQQDQFKIYESQSAEAQKKIDDLQKENDQLKSLRDTNADQYSNLMLASPGMTAEQIQRQKAINDLAAKGITDPNEILTTLNSGTTGTWTADDVTNGLNEYYNPTGFREKMEKAGNEKYQLDEQYKQRKSLTDEASQLADIMNNDLAAAKTASTSIAFSQEKQSQITEKYIGRISAIQTAVAGIDGNISLAETLIDRGINAVNADRTDRLNYLNWQKSLYDTESTEANAKLLIATTDQKAAITNEINMLQGKITETENNKQSIMKLLTDSTTAMTAIKAGVSITDTPEQAIQKIQEYQKVNGDDKLLTPNEAKSLGVPYGTTKGQAANMKITPKKSTGSTAPKLTPEEKEFQTKLKSEQSNLAKGGSWGSSWNYLKNLYPDINNAVLDSLLNKDKYYTQTGKKSAANNSGDRQP